MPSKPTRPAWADKEARESEVDDDISEDYSEGSSDLSDIDDSAADDTVETTSPSTLADFIEGTSRVALGGTMGSEASSGFLPLRYQGPVPDILSTTHNTPTSDNEQEHTSEFVVGLGTGVSIKLDARTKVIDPSIVPDIPESDNDGNPNKDFYENPFATIGKKFN